MSYAKQLFSAPMAMLAQAAGSASMPFFASLWTQNKRYDFATGVADSVSRVASLSLLSTSAMIVLGYPAIDLVFTGGRFTQADASHCAAYFAVFSLALFLWSAQSVYARAFFAAGNTIAPMAAGTVVTIVSLPIYYALYHAYGAMGLALASNVGIALQTLAVAVLLHQRRMVSLASLDFAEMGRCLAAGVAGGGAVALLIWALNWARSHAEAAHWAQHARVSDAVLLAVGTIVWLLLVGTVLEKSGSALPRVTMKRLGLKRA
jgi:putative peptidoglycan lipid II flippase